MVSPMTEIEYLKAYHHTSQHLIGIAIMNMTAEQIAKVNPFREELQMLRLKYILCTTEISDDDLETVFGFDRALIDRARESVSFADMLRDKLPQFKDVPEVQGREV